MDIDEIAISPMTQSLSMDEAASNDVDVMDWDLDSQYERNLTSTIAHGDSSLGDGETEPAPLVSHQDGRMAQEPSLRAVPAHIEISPQLSAEPDAASAELSCGNG